MEIIISETALEHISYWKKTNNKKVQQRIKQLTYAILNNPFQGIGKPEPLKYQLAGKWSRRIDNENRFVYKIENDILIILSLKGHY